MRLWHKDLIPYLPQKQLVAQWRELLAIKGSIEKHGTPRHALVNKVLKYPWQSYADYTYLVLLEFEKRGYNYSKAKYQEFIEWVTNNSDFKPSKDVSGTTPLYDGWHDDRYLKQCLYNLQEKYDCGIVPIDDWIGIYTEFSVRRNLI